MNGFKVMVAAVGLTFVQSGKSFAQSLNEAPGWYARGALAVARIDGGEFTQPELRGFDLALGRDVGAGRRVRGVIELQGEWLAKGPDDPTCLIRPNATSCAPLAPDLRIVSLTGGAAIQRTRWRIAALVGPAIVATEGDGQHGGVTARFELVARASRTFGIAAGVQTTQLQSLQSTTLWIPRANVGFRLGFP